MSWIIKIEQEYFEYAYTFTDGSDQGGIMTTQIRDSAKQFDTKQDAAAYMHQYDITGHIIPA